ncbi:hypothetical protein ADT71_17240 [Novosphingobium sp. ST904]|nr:hypothetical protein ADT71_17240 [Novosphingobium sp. ST904]
MRLAQSQPRIGVSGLEQQGAAEHDARLFGLAKMKQGLRVSHAEPGGRVELHIAPLQREAYFLPLPLLGKQLDVKIIDSGIACRDLLRLQDNGHGLIDPALRIVGIGERQHRHDTGGKGGDRLFISRNRRVGPAALIREIAGQNQRVVRAGSERLHTGKNALRTAKIAGFQPIAGIGHSQRNILSRRHALVEGRNCAALITQRQACLSAHVPGLRAAVARKQARGFARATLQQGDPRLEPKHGSAPATTTGPQETSERALGGRGISKRNLRAHQQRQSRAISRLILQRGNQRGTGALIVLLRIAHLRRVELASGIVTTCGQRDRDQNGKRQANERLHTLPLKAKP